jgi:hypothetical protein
MLGICLPYVEFVIPLHFQSLEQINHNIYSKKPIEKSYAKYYSQLGLSFICGVLSLSMVIMSKVIKFVRERTPFILVVYGAYIYFRSYSSRAASDILSL